MPPPSGSNGGRRPGHTRSMTFSTSTRQILVEASRRRQAGATWPDPRPRSMLVDSRAMDDQNYLPPERPPRKPGQEPSSKLTLDAYVRMRKELEGLKGEGRTNMAERLLRAREFGDIMENAEYDAAKNEQGLMEARIRSLER